MSSFSEYMKKSKSSSVDILNQKLQEISKPSFQRDERLWNIQKDKTGNGFAIIRFLPAKEATASPFVRYWSHAFKGPSGSWYIENCPTTLGKKCPVCERNSALWNSGVDSDKEIARSRKRKLVYVSNVLVIKDGANPDNEGKVFLFNYGTKIFDKIQACMHPEYDGDVAVNPFDFLGGKNFRLKVKTVFEYSNYDDSTFDQVSPLHGGNEEKIEKVWNGLYDLNEFVDPAKFKEYDELKSRFVDVIGDNEPQAPSQPSFTPPTKKASTPAKEVEKSGDEDDDALNYFKKLDSE